MELVSSRLILSNYVRLRFPNGLLFSGPTVCMHFSSHPYVLYATRTLYVNISREVYLRISYVGMLYSWQLYIYNFFFFGSDIVVYSNPTITNFMQNLVPNSRFDSILPHDEIWGDENLDYGLLGCDAV
jgi:hypothetical protein